MAPRDSGNLATDPGPSGPAGSSSSGSSDVVAQARDLSRSFGDHVVLDHLDLDIA